MAPADPLLTFRVVASYTGPRGSHTMLFHGDRNASLLDVVSDVRTLIEEMTILQLDTTTWDSAVLYEPDSNISFPLTWDPIVADTSYTATSANPEGYFGQFGGRASNGRRFKLYLYELGLGTTRDNRIGAEELTDVGTVIAAINDAYVLGNLRTIANGAIAQAYPYMNLNLNDYLVRRSRQ